MFSSTYSNTDFALGKLDSRFFNVTTTAAGPAPVVGEPAGNVLAAGGKIAVSVVALVTLTVVA
jgi:hypothetical protein